MTTYNTQNPLGSSDPRDLYDNAENLDVLTNSREALSNPDRFGVQRKTWHGMELSFNNAQSDRLSRFNSFIANSGYSGTGINGEIEDYRAGITIVEYNQIIRDPSGGEMWRVSGATTLPYTTTGSGLPEGGALVSVGDASLRQELNIGSVNGLGYISVKSFGAVGDGVNDDTNAIKDALASAQDGGVIYLPRGIYKITSGIEWKTKVSMIGAGVGLSVIKMVGSIFSAIYHTSSGPTGGGDASVEPLEDVRFENFEIDGTGLTSTESTASGKGIFINYMRRARFKNLYIHHTIGTGLGCDFHDDTVIESCVASHCGKNFEPGGVGQSGIGIGTGWKGQEPIVITNCFTSYNGNFGIFVEIQDKFGKDFRPHGAVISGNYARGNRVGFSNLGSGGVIFSDNYAFENTEQGFHTYAPAYSYNIITGCKSESNGLDGFWLEDTSAVDVVSGCVSLNNGRHGFFLSPSALTYEYPGGRGVNILGCNAEGNSSNGIQIRTRVGSQQGAYRLSDSSFINSGESGIVASQLKEMHIKNCISSENISEGLYFLTEQDDGEFYIDSSRFSRNGRTGVKLSGGGTSDLISIKGSFFLNNGLSQTSSETNGFEAKIKSKEIVFQGNFSGNLSGSPTQTRGAYFVLQDSATVATVKYNIFRGNTDFPVSISGGGLSVIRGNEGYNYRPPLAESLGPSPSTPTIRRYDYMVYLVGSGITVSIDGEDVVQNVSAATVFIPANSTVVITYSGSIRNRFQRM